MKTEFWRQGAVATIAAGLLAVAAVAQTGEASGEVKIEGNKPPAATTTAVVKPAAKPVKPAITDRDPFVNLVDSGVVVGTSAPQRPNRTTGAPTVRTAATSISKATSGGGSSRPVAVVEEVEVVEIPAPEVTITGIVKAHGAHQAIVNSGTGSYIVSPGQKLGDYRVASITDTAVTFTHTGKSFKVPIDSQFGLKK